jgi:hypothetical protein
MELTDHTDSIGFAIRPLLVLHLHTFFYFESAAFTLPDVWPLLVVIY